MALFNKAPIPLTPTIPREILSAIFPSSLMAIHDTNAGNTVGNRHFNTMSTQDAPVERNASISPVPCSSMVAAKSFRQISNYRKIRPIMPPVLPKPIPATTIKTHTSAGTARIIATHPLIKAAKILLGAIFAAAKKEVPAN